MDSEIYEQLNGWTTRHWDRARPYAAHADEAHPGVPLTKLSRGALWGPAAVPAAIAADRPFSAPFRRDL